MEPPRRRIFPPRQATSTLAGKREFNKGQPELQVLRSCASSAEKLDFPSFEQVALSRRRRCQHSPETVAPVTRLPPAELNAAQWLEDNRAAWGIESGLHQRLDVSHRDDQCRGRLPQSMRLIGMFRRFSNRLFMHWRRRQKNPGPKPPPTSSPSRTPNIIAMPSAAFRPVNQASAPLRELAVDRREVEREALD